MDDLSASTPPATQVRAGMQVLDRAGDDVGTVTLVRMGDPQAATDAGQDNINGPLETVAAFFGKGEPDVHPQYAARLRRTGFLKIDRSSLLRGDVYVPADEVTRVQGETVHLRTSRDDLVSGS